MADSTQPASDPCVVNLSVGAGIPCVRCGYDLRGLDAARHCPECGLGIARSIALGKELEQSRPTWLRTLSLAAWLLWLANLLPLAVFVLVLVVTQYREETRYARLSINTVAIVMLVGALEAHALGAWLLTRPENRYATRRPMRYLGLLLRFCALVPAVAIPLVFVVPDSPNFPDDVIVALLLYTLVLYIPCPLLESVILRRLAGRMQDAGLAEHTVIAGLGYTLALLGIPVMFGAALVFGWRDPWAMVLIMYVSLFLFWLWSMYVMGSYGLAFRRAARQAQAAWRAADAARAGDAQQAG